MNTALSSVVRVIHCALLSVSWPQSNCVSLSRLRPTADDCFGAHAQARIAGSKSKRRVKVILVGHSLGGYGRDQGLNFCITSTDSTGFGWLLESFRSASRLSDWMSWESYGNPVKPLCIVYN